MNYYIKEWPDGSATLMTENGHYLVTFYSLEEAKKTYLESCGLNATPGNCYLESTQDVSCSNCFSSG